MVEKKKYYHSKLNEGERQGGKCEGVGGGKAEVWKRRSAEALLERKKSE